MQSLRLRNVFDFYFMPHSFDRVLVILVIALVSIGFLIFSSASLGLLARHGASFTSVATNQFFYGIVGGSIALFVTSSIHYRVWRQFAFYLFLATLALTLLVFIPELGRTHGGARRWVDLGFISFQPGEFLKIGFTIYMATWLSGMKGRINDFVHSTLPFVGILIIVGIPVLKQPDTDMFLITVTAALAMFITVGGRVRDVVLMTITAILLIAVLAYFRPYVKERILTFIHPSSDLQGAGYQINQSLIAVGSGGLFGRGFGQSIQKFEYLPEPISDSIFAVYSEEFGFVGSTLLVLLILAFTFRGYRIATHAPDLFAMLLVVGLMTLFVTQSFLNIASMLGLVPLSGLTLPLISHGGTSLFVMLGAIGIIINISKYQKQSRA